MVNRCYLKPAAIDAGIITQNERFGFHLLRHSLSTWVNVATKDVKVVQTLLRHSKPDITAGIYIHGVPKENLKAQERYVRAMMKSKRPSQVKAESLLSAKPASSSIQ
jgi:integrase